MEFTSRELKQIERLRKQERQWPRTRWMLMGLGIFLLAVYGCLLAFYYHLLFPAENDATPFGDLLSRANILMFAIFWPKFLLAFCFSGWCIVKAITEWHGNINRRLLLKLLEAQQAQSTSPGKIT
jgi:uncharacterized membrane protein